MLKGLIFSHIYTYSVTMDSTQLEVQITEFSICASDLYGRAVLDMSTESHLLFARGSKSEESWLKERRKWGLKQTVLDRK